MTNGQADVYNNNNTISANFRDSQLFYADGSSNNATINWHGTSTIGFGWETSSTSSTTYTAKKTTYVGEFSGFDGSTQSVTNLSDLKAYNAWLVSQVQAGNLSTSAYTSELNKAYQNTGTTYVINPLPADADPILLSPPGTVVLLYGSGSGANINLASDSYLTSTSLRGLDNGGLSSSLIRLENGANSVNDGYISTGFRIGVLYSGSRLTNNGTMITGSMTGGGEGYGIYASGTGTEFINNGIFNVIPMFWSNLASQNQGNNVMVTALNGAKVVNNGVVNLGITEGTRTTEYLGPTVGVSLASASASFINSADGEMYVGRSQDGKDMFAAAGSAAIKVSSLSSGTVDNQGLITLGTKSNSVYGITANSTMASARIINSGTIAIKGNGGDGTFLPGQNIGIYAYNNAKGISNTGAINVGGINNIGIKAYSGGQVSSSGQINVTGSADPSTDLRNYGAWASSANSLVDISGTVNLEGDGAIGLHARDKGTISLSGNGQVTFADGENQIGYYVYGAGSKITNTSAGSQDVTTNNSTLMRLDGGAAFVGSSSATSTMSASGEGSTVIVVTGAGTTVDSGGMTVNVNGKNATGFLVEGGATGTIGATATMNLSGEGAIAGIADGQGYDLAGAERVMTDDEKRATRLTAGAHLTSSLDGVVGYIARNLATLTNSGNISFSGKGATGIQVEEGAVGGNSGNITLSGAGSVGLSATANTTEIRLGSTGNITLNGDWDGADSQTRSAGVLAKGSQVEVTVGDGVNAASVNLNGAGTVGVHASEGSKVTLNDNVAVNFDSDKSDQIAFWIDGAGSAIDTLAGTTLTHVHGDGATLFYVTDGASLSGDLGIVAGNGANELTLSNLDNSYTGATDVQSGTLIVGTNNALGQTANLKLATATTVNLNGKTQTIGALNGTAGSTLSLNGGSLTLTNGGTSSGSLTGSGNLTVAGGSLTVTSANAGLSATTTVDAGAEALLQNVQALGTGAVVANGDLTLHGADGTFANAVSGSGTLSSRNGSDVRLSGNNAGFSGVVDIDMASTLTVSETQHLGEAFAVLNSNRFIVDNAAAMALNALVSGTGNLIKQNAGTLTLGGTNVYSGKTDIQNGTVAISADANLGDGSATNLTVLNGGNLQITADLTSARDVTLEKSGGIIVDSGVTATMNGWDDTGNAANAITKAGDGTLIWTGNNGANTADVNVTGGVLQIAEMDNLASSTGVVNLGASGTLSILKDGASADDVDFTRTLTGSGTLAVNLGDRDNDFTFNTSAAGGNFSGTVAMDNGRFVLDAVADNVMGLATLALNGDGTRLGSVKLDGSHAIGGLQLNGGRIEVDYSGTDHRPLGTLTVNTLDATGGGQLTITTPANLPNPIPTSGTSLFDQDDNVSDQIVMASTVNGVGSQIQVTQADGTPVAADTLVGLVQDGVAAGNAHYNYFGAVKSDGLYLGYGLTQLDAFAGQSVILSNAGATDDKLGARLTGDGGFTLNVSGTVHIGNAASDYLGATDVNSGTVVLITDNGFGKTSSLNMQSGSGVDLNGNAQTVGQLDAASGSTFNLNGGELTVSNGGTAAGALTGSGQLTLTGGQLDVTQNNGSLTATTDIASGATARLTAPQGLGQGIINLAGTLNLDGARGTLFNGLNGDGEVTLTNGANMYLGGNSQHYSGLFTVNADTTLTATAAANLGKGTVNNDGTLVVETDSLWTLTNAVSGSGTVVKRGSGTVVIDGDNVQASQTTIENGVLQLCKVATTAANLTGNVTIGQYGALGGYGTVTGNVTNAGNLVMGHALTGAGQGTFTIDGDYVGDGGTVIFNTDLGGDGSSTDKLLITGDSSGESKVSVVSARGNGAQTENGIKLIEVQGASNGTFTQSGRALAGAYEYFLYQGGVSTPDDGDWYLRSALNADNPQPSVYRPEAGGYMANMAAANRLFTLRLADREGRAENSSLWLRQAGSRQSYHDNSGQLNTSTNSYVIQGGGEISHIDTSDTGRAGLGVMLGYGYAKSKTDSQKTGYRADSSVKGYSTGLYGTWYQDANTLNGAYVDSWVQYSWLDAEVSGQQVASESYDMDGFSASLEAGYRMPVYESANGRVYLTPQGQVTWSGITADTVREANGTKVTSSGDNNVQTRLGLKVSRDGVSDIDKGKEKLFTVYAEANWLYNSEQAGATMDGVTVSQAGSRNVGELKLGAEGQLNRNLNLWSNVAQQLGDKGYSDTAVTLGVKYRF